MKHVHNWAPLREGYPQLICKCGALKAKEVKAGQNTITLGPSGTADVARFTTSSPTVSQAGDLSVDANAGRPVAFVGGGTYSGHQVEEPDVQRFWSWSADPSGVTTTQNEGTTVAISGFVSTAVRTTSGLIFMQTTAGAGTPGYQTGTTLATSVTQPNYRPYFTAIIRTHSSVANQRTWVALTPSDPTGTGVPTSTLGWRYDTSSGDTTWICYTSGPVSGSTQVNTGITVVADTVYVMQMRIATTSRAEFVTRTAGAAPVTSLSTANFPTTVQVLNVQVRSRALVSGAGIGFGHISIQEGQRVI
jgi:hypothetical protein